jgi:hypothetical protein
VGQALREGVVNTMYILLAAAWCIRHVPHLLTTMCSSRWVGGAGGGVHMLKAEGGRRSFIEKGHQFCVRRASRSDR